MIRKLALAAALCASPQLVAACPPSGHDRASLEALRAAKFELADHARRQSLALAMIPCLAHTDPQLRDGIAFEAYSSWMRADLLDVATRAELLEKLLLMVEPDKNDHDGFRQPFAALVLSELARTDRLKPWMTEKQRARLVDAGARYLASVRDYRGFDPKGGWRHGVAHSADLATQLVLNSNVDRAAVDRLLAAVASPAPLPDWGAAFQSREGLAKRHNVNAFLFALYVSARESGDERMQVLVPGLQAAFKTL